MFRQLDGKTGNLIWEHRLGGNTAMRGMALYDDKLFLTMSDANLVALDLDAVVLPAHAEVHEAEEAPQVLEAREIGAYPGHVGRFELVRPAVAEPFGRDLQLGPRQAGWAAATVRHRTFLGERIHLRLEATGQAPLVADVPRDSPFQVGDQVGLWIAPDRLMASMEPAA